MEAETLFSALHVQRKHWLQSVKGVLKISHTAAMSFGCNCTKFLGDVTEVDFFVPFVYSYFVKFPLVNWCS